MLLMAGGRHQRAVGREHKAAKLRANAHIAHAGRHEHLLIRLAHALADGHDVVGLILRAIGNAHASGEIDKRDMRAGLTVQIDGGLKENARQRRIIRIGQRIRREESMQAKVLCALLHQHAIGLGQLSTGHAVLGVLGLIHDLVADGEFSARIIAAGDGLGNAAAFLERLDERVIVQIDDRTHAVCEGELARLGFVGGEHDLMPFKAACTAEHQLGLRGAVHAAALLAKNLEDKRIGRGLDGEILFKALVPGKRLIQRTGRTADARLVVDMKRRRIFACDRLRLIERDKRFLFTHMRSSFPPHRAAADMKMILPHYTYAFRRCQDHVARSNP